MDQHVLDYMKPLTEKELDKDYFEYLIDKIKQISNNNVKGFMNKISKNKNKISDVDKTLILEPIIMQSSKISQKDKLIIFYYIYYYHNITLNNDLVNLKKKKKLIDIEYKKPNSYVGYYNNEAYQIKILIDEDSDLTKIYKNYKVMEMYNIPIPEIELEYRFGDKKTVVIPKNRKLLKEDDKKEVFLQILNILRICNQNKIFVTFDYWNIRYVNGRYYLLNVKNLTRSNKIDMTKQIKMLQYELEYPKTIRSYQYDKIFAQLVLE